MPRNGVGLQPESLSIPPKLVSILKLRRKVNNESTGQDLFVLAPTYCTRPSSGENK